MLLFALDDKKMIVANARAFAMCSLRNVKVTLPYMWSSAPNAPIDCKYRPPRVHETIVDTYFRRNNIESQCHTNVGIMVNVFVYVSRSWQGL